MLKLPANNELQMTWYNTSHALWMAGFSIQQLLVTWILVGICLLYTSPSPRDAHESRMPSSA